MNRYAWSLVASVGLVIATGVLPAEAQLLGTLTWQQQPYCNRLTVTIAANGDGYAVDGFDDQCGAALRASVAGTSVVNGDGTIGLGLTVITVPGGAPSHIDARVNPSSGNGPWIDATGATGMFVLGAAAAGAPRPLPPTRTTWGLTLVAPSVGAGPGLVIRRDLAATWPAQPALRAEYGAPAVTGTGTASAVFATSQSGVAIAGATDGGVGVLGFAGGSPSGVAIDASSTAAIAVRARAFGGSVGVVAQHDSGKTALEVSNGAVKVSGSVRPAFQHTTTAAKTAGHVTTLDHPLLNGDPVAMVFTMHAYVPGATVNDPKEKSVWYDTALGRWRIYHDDLSPMPLNLRFNVLVVKQ
jgi:hypothetical protein